MTYQPSTEAAPVTINAVIFLPDEEESDRAFVQKIRNLGFGGQGDSDAFAVRKFGSSSEVGPLHRASGSLTEGHGRREAEGSEAAKAIVAADGVGDHESQLS